MTSILKKSIEKQHKVSSSIDVRTFPGIDFLPHFSAVQTVGHSRTDDLPWQWLWLLTNGGHRVSIADEITLVFSSQRSPTNVCWHLLLSSRSQAWSGPITWSSRSNGLLSNSNGKCRLEKKTEIRRSIRLLATGILMEKNHVCLNVLGVRSVSRVFFCWLLKFLLYWFWFNEQLIYISLNN